MTVPRLGVPDLGVGVGLRPLYAQRLINEPPDAITWVECISENFMVAGGAALQQLDALRQRLPVVLHGVSLDLGGPDPLSRSYLTRLRSLVDRVRPPWVSDHLCWSGADGVHLHDLLPLPLTDEAVQHVVGRIKQAQDALSVPFAIENVSSYMTFRADEMPEWAFLSRVADEADCGILLDVNNIYVSARNHGFSPEAYLDAIPAHRVMQIHLAGHTDLGTHLRDTHASHVCDEVWALYRRTCERVGPCSTLIEWDDDLPPLEVLVAEVEKAWSVRREVLP